MSKVAIVTDSTAAIPTDILEQYPIWEVPQVIIFGEEVLEDRIDIQPGTKARQGWDRHGIGNDARDLVTLRAFTTAGRLMGRDFPLPVATTGACPGTLRLGLLFHGRTGAATVAESVRHAGQRNDNCQGDFCPDLHQRFPEH